MDSTHLCDEETETGNTATGQEVLEPRSSLFSRLPIMRVVHESRRDDRHPHACRAGAGIPPLAAYPNRPGSSHYDIRRGVIAEHLAALLEGLVLSEDEAQESGKVWMRINNVLDPIEWNIVVPIDTVLDSIEDSKPVLYSDARFGCQDYYPWLGGDK